MQKFSMLLQQWVDDRFEELYKVLSPLNCLKALKELSIGQVYDVLSLQFRIPDVPHIHSNLSTATKTKRNRWDEFFLNFSSYENLTKTQ